ncbi:glycine-rich domain-containing protein [Rosenbergiella epipactidis]|uniref:glycine-rich domain-containing protein n=1 Tax=Rosenbergiella epipactidis TaxID=1544694 RepID=UPI001F4DFD4F|nr:glycine-rich domain-containing protein-like [Rosenbergiella epipactidis]
MLEDIASTLPHSMDVFEVENEPTLEEAVNYIDEMDFTLLKDKLSRNDPLTCRVWSKKELEMTEQYYKNFLYLNKKYGKEIKIIVPSIEIDEFWHHHILDTRSYMRDSLNIFGYYFHHYPYFGTRGDEDKANLDYSFEVTQVIYESEFNERMLNVWGS